MKVKTYYQQNKDKFKKIINDNGGDFDKFIKSFKSEIKKKFKYKKKKSLLVKKSARIILDQETYIKYKLVCISEELNEKILLESFMNYFCEGDYELPLFLQKLDNYNNSSFLYTKRAERREKRKRKALLLIKKQNLNKEWLEKYTNININEVDF